MDNKRYPYDSPRDRPRQPPPVGSMNPMELEGALYMQRRQQEMQRDLQLRQMLLRDQIGRQQNIHQQRMYGLHQQFAGQQALASLQRDEQVLQDQIMRRRQLQQQMQQSHLPISSPIGSPITRPISTETMIADSLSANATRKPSGNRKRSIDHSDGTGGDGQQKYARKDSSFSSFSSSTLSANDNHRDALLLAEASMQNKDSDYDLQTSTQRGGCSPDITHEAQAIEGFQALATQATPPTDSYAYESLAVDQGLYTKGTLESLLKAGKAEEEVDEAATVMVTLQNVHEISDSEPNGLGIDSGDEDGGNSVSIVLPRFKSKLPQLPVEPELDAKKKAPDKKAANNKTESGTDQEETKDSEGSSAARTSSPKKDVELAAEPKENGDKLKAKEETIQPTEYPYPVDTWWPSVATVRRERRMNGEDTDEENFAEERLFEEDSSFRADTRKIQSRIANDVKPGVLEKLPHCKIHRLKTRKLKGATIPDHAFCWQVTETYCNDIMVCCSICSTWRHAGCGGHYKPYSVRENVESKEPFVPVCDLCHAERTLLQDFPLAATRLERQRIEQLRRALSTSAVIRQAAFVKYGGTYKWPLGSVSGTHINGHTRSVHTRHDKAEKTWSDVTSRLGRGHGYRPKERSRVRTREFERLLICVEDGESIMERHNMIQFLQNDCRKEYPAGYEKHLRNLFDPDDDEVPNQEADEVASAPSQEEETLQEGLVGRKPPAMPTRLAEGTETGSQQTEDTICARSGCCKKPRFDSLFCSDSCGILELEGDLLRAMYVAEEMHPSLMRS